MRGARGGLLPSAHLQLEALALGEQLLARQLPQPLALRLAGHAPRRDGRRPVPLVTHRRHRLRRRLRRHRRPRGRGGVGAQLAFLPRAGAAGREAHALRRRRVHGAKLRLLLPVLRLVRGRAVGGRARAGEGGGDGVLGLALALGAGAVRR